MSPRNDAIQSRKSNFRNSNDFFLAVGLRIGSFFRVVSQAKMERKKKHSYLAAIQIDKWANRDLIIGKKECVILAKK